MAKTKKRLFIAGAGGFGRELLDWALDVPPGGRDWEVHGFLDQQAGTLKTSYGNFPIWADAEKREFDKSERVICAIGDPRIKLRCCRSLRQRGARFITLIHPTAVLGSNNRFGEGCILCPNAAISNNVTLGDFVMLNAYSTIGHDSVLGDGCTLSSHADVTGWTVLGEGVFLGSHAVILPHAEVGAYAVVGAGSVVLRKVKEGKSVFGVPAVEI